MSIEVIDERKIEKPEKVICVFCGSSNGKDPIFMEKGFELGQRLAEEGYGLVYGGGNLGIMGSVAKGVTSKGGYVHGVIPKALFDRERDMESVSEIALEKTTVVLDMHTRKKLMGQEADAFISLPGGYGTLEELAEVTTWAQLGIHDKPVICYNINGFFEGLQKFFKHSIECGFIQEKHGSVVSFQDTIDGLMREIVEYKRVGNTYGLKWGNQ